MHRPHDNGEKVELPTLEYYHPILIQWPTISEEDTTRMHEQREEEETRTLLLQKNHDNTRYTYPTIHRRLINVHDSQNLHRRKDAPILNDDDPPLVFVTLSEQSLQEMHQMLIQHHHKEVMNTSTATTTSLVWSHHSHRHHHHHAHRNNIELSSHCQLVQWCEFKEISYRETLDMWKECGGRHDLECVHNTHSYCYYVPGEFPMETLGELEVVSSLMSSTVNHRQSMTIDGHYHDHDIDHNESYSSLSDKLVEDDEESSSHDYCHHHPTTALVGNATVIRPSTGFLQQLLLLTQEYSDTGTEAEAEAEAS